MKLMARSWRFVLPILATSFILILLASAVWAEGNRPVDFANRIAGIAGTVVGSIVFVGFLLKINRVLGVLGAIGALIVIIRVIFLGHP